uniref:Uncharacterized protein n=1 Tax=Oryza nivara TaxID=4536 RepID=A0A0E0HC72_ORYNI
MRQKPSARPLDTDCRCRTASHGRPPTPPPSPGEELSVTVGGGAGVVRSRRHGAWRGRHGYQERSWVAAGEGGRGRPSPRFSPSPLPHRLRRGPGGGRKRRTSASRGQRRWRRGGCRRAGELEGVDGDVVAVVELDGTVDGAAGVGLAEAVEAVEDRLVLADIEALERPNLVLLGLRHTRRFAPLTPVPPRPTGLLTYTRLPAAVAVPGSTPAMANWAETARPSTTTTSSRPTSRSTWRAVARDRAPLASSP